MTTLVAKPAVPWRDWRTLPVAYDEGGILVLELPKPLASPNRLIRRHWRTLARERQDWSGLVWAALLRRPRVGDGHPGLNAAGAWVTAARRMHVAIDRIVPRRQFLRDDDNLQFSSKSLLDALTAARLIRDDSRTWLEREPVVQIESPDGRARTRVRLWADVPEEAA